MTSFKSSSLSDWSFLVLIWLAGVSGFALELSLYLPQAPVWAIGCFFSTSPWQWSWFC